MISSLTQFEEVLEETKSIQIEDKIAQIPSLHRMVILKIIAANTFDSTNSPFTKQWVQSKDWTVEYAIEILNELKTGILEILKQ